MNQSCEICYGNRAQTLLKILHKILYIGQRFHTLRRRVTFEATSRRFNVERIGIHVVTLFSNPNYYHYCNYHYDDNKKVKLSL
jgi:hypothetical protein